MGIERFFNTLKDKFNIINEIKPNSDIKIKCNCMFFDFNSIIHMLGSRLNNIINTAMIENLKKLNKVSNSNPNKYLNILNINDSFCNDLKTEINVIDAYHKYFNDDKLDEIMIYLINLYIHNFLDSYFDLKLIHFSIDGTPTKAKIIEQKKRRYMGEFDKKFKSLLIEKYKYLLNKKNDLYNKYNYLINIINFDKSNISPGTTFMNKLSKFLNSNDFKRSLIKKHNNLIYENIIVSDHNIKEEGEKKIVDFINDTKNDVNGELYIYTPDADVILLALILKNKNINKYVVRVNQQKNVDINKVLYSFYDIININKLEDEMYNYIKSPLNKDYIIRDIVFIFTFFGDDFLPKIESIDVKIDIDLIINIYKDYLKITDHRSLLENDENIKLNFKRFLELIKIISELEPNLVIRNYYNKKYKNYNYLIDKINVKLANGDYDYKKVDHNNINKFISEYNNKDKKLPNLNSDKLKLFQYPNSIKDTKYKKILGNKNDYEIELFQFENMLDKYYHIMNKKYETSLGNPNLTFKNGKEIFYKDFFHNSKLDSVIQNYIFGIIWIVEYYFNDNLYHKWCYKYHKSPLITDILRFLMNKDRIYFEDLKNELQQYKVDKYLTPLEHFLYITPFDKENSHLRFIRDYPNDTLKKIKTFLNNIKQSKYKDLYPNVRNIAYKIIKGINHNEIDCRLVHFQNKCIINSVDKSNIIDEQILIGKF